MTFSIRDRYIHSFSLILSPNLNQLGFGSFFVRLASNFSVQSRSLSTVRLWCQCQNFRTAEGIDRVEFFIFFSLQGLQHILDLGKQEHREGEKRDPRRHWSSIRPSLVRWCRSALGGDGRSSGRRRVAGDVEVDGGVVQGLRASRRFSASRRSGRD